MDNPKKTSYFTVLKEKCVGCALCVAACPMKILKIIDELCVMTDENNCLECGSCRDKCPERAIIVANKNASIKNTIIETDNNHSKIVRDPDTKFIPIVKHLTKIIFSTLQPVQIFDYKGMNFQEINKFTLDKNPCFIQLYNTDKIEKIAASSINFFGDMTAEVICITPAAEYDLPYYMMDWDESEDHIFFFCDVVPSDDLMLNSSHLEEYYYKPLEDLYLEYSFNINGLTKSPFHWVRAIHSPYTITGTINKKDQESLYMIFDCAEKYLRAWIKLWQNAAPLDSSSEISKRINQRRKIVTKLYHENDPGGGAITKFLGEQKGNKVMTAMMP